MTTALRTVPPLPDGDTSRWAVVVVTDVPVDDVALRDAVETALHALRPARLHAVPAAGTQPVDRLTPREREVLVLLADVLSNAEIARRLFLSEATVKTHVARVLTKLDVRDRVQAVVAAFRAGVVPSGPVGA